MIKTKVIYKFPNEDIVELIIPGPEIECAPPRELAINFFDGTAVALFVSSEEVSDD